MAGRFFVAGVGVVVSLMALLPVAAAAQPATGEWSVPRTPDGYPDLQGVWANNNATPARAPRGVGGAGRA